MKARRVKGLDPHAPLAANAARIVATRLDELFSFMPAAADPAAVVALHDMRIAAKRLRYVLEVTHGCFGPYARDSVRVAKRLQDLLGEIHDCDVQLPLTAAVLAAAVEEDAAVLATLAGDSADVGPALLGRAPHRAAYAGLIGIGVQLRARRELLFARFLAMWRELERDGFRERLERAVEERPPG